MKINFKIINIKKMKIRMIIIQLKMMINKIYSNSYNIKNSPLNLQIKKSIKKVTNQRKKMKM